ncbi:MAG: hypothetical protein BRD44_01820 [Bacteroidetes bacterium QS_7_67_15]|nr:MAG: hypothetical protein BRD44_01820 [Bacteroidetes bacterium QS_7_67_15]
MGCPRRSTRSPAALRHSHFANRPSAMSNPLRDLFFGGGGFSSGSQAADVIEPQRTFADVVLPEETRCQLDRALTQIRKRRLIGRDWGLAERHPTGLGLAFNFAGPPGTGKTLCAEALADALDRNLMLVRYDEMQSMWMGATGKNIASVFDAARSEEAVLFRRRRAGLRARGQRHRERAPARAGGARRRGHLRHQPGGQPGPGLRATHPNARRFRDAERRGAPQDLAGPAASQKDPAGRRRGLRGAGRALRGQRRRHQKRRPQRRAGRRGRAGPGPEEKDRAAALHSGHGGSAGRQGGHEPVALSPRGRRRGRQYAPPRRRQRPAGRPRAAPRRRRAAAAGPRRSAGNAHRPPRLAR